MEDKFNPLGFLIHMVLYGLYLGCVLAIAIPFRELLTRTAKTGYQKTKDALRTSTTVKFKGTI